MRKAWDKASGSPGGTFQPVRSEGATSGGERTVSGAAPMSVTITGLPRNWASVATRPKASGWVEQTVMAEAVIMAAGMSAQWPTRCTTPSRPAAEIAASSSLT